MNDTDRALAKNLADCTDEELALRIRERLAMVEMEARMLQARGWRVEFTAKRTEHLSHPNGIPKLDMIAGRRGLTEARRST